MGVCAYTIVSRAYVPHARVLARTFSDHHADGEFWALLIDDVDGEISGDGEPFRVLRLSDLDVGLPEIHRMAMLFGNRIIAAIKPWVFEHLLRAGLDAVIYIDSDFMIFDSLAGVTRDAAEHGVAVVPHIIRPMPRDGFQPDETTVLGVGTFNAGFFAVGQNGTSFIKFLKERLRRECFTNVPKMRVNEQRWLDFVPALFSHAVVKDPGIDVAPWNIHERPLSVRAGRYHAGEVPLRAFHFSGFDPRLPDVMSARDYWDRPRVPMESEPALAQIYATYASRLFDAGFEMHQTIPFAFDTLADGNLIYAGLRGLYADRLMSAEKSRQVGPPDPFDPKATIAFREWAERAFSDAGEHIPTRLSAGPDGPLSGEDWTGRMSVGDAGERTRAGFVHMRPGRAGSVLVGPGAPLDAGHYRATIEMLLDESTDGATPSDSNVILIEALLDGFVLGNASTGQAGLSAVELDFVIPVSMRRLALSAGVQLSIQSRTGVSGSIDSVRVQRLSGVDSVEEGRWSPDWLAAMSVGDVGVREEVTIVKPVGVRGFMAEGPRWRLAKGRYLAELGLHGDANSIDLSTVVALVDVVIHGYVIGFKPVTQGDLLNGRTTVGFEVGGRWETDRYTRVELRVRAESAVAARLDFASVFEVDSSNAGLGPLDRDWLPALWVHDAAMRSGSEIHSRELAEGLMAQGPSWRLDPGTYELQVAIDAMDGGSFEAGSRPVASIQVLLDGASVGERLIRSDQLNEPAKNPSRFAIAFVVRARKVPEPLLELSPIVDLAFVASENTVLRILSAVVTRIGDTQ